MLIEERQYLVIKEICRCQGGLLRVALCKAGVAMGIKSRPLVSFADTFDKADVASTLGNEKTRVRTLDLSCLHGELFVNSQEDLLVLPLSWPS